MSDEVIDEISDILLETPLDGIVATNGTTAAKGCIRATWRSTRSAAAA